MRLGSVLLYSVKQRSPFEGFKLSPKEQRICELMKRKTSTRMTGNYMETRLESLKIMCFFEKKTNVLTPAYEECVHKANRFCEGSLFLHGGEALCCQRGCDCGE